MGEFCTRSKIEGKEVITIVHVVFCFLVVPAVLLAVGYCLVIALEDRL